MKYNHTVNALNVLNSDAIIYPFADGTSISLTRADFQSDEEFQKWKSWSDENNRVTENKNYTYRYHSVSTEVIRDKALSSPSLDDIYLYEEERIEKLADLLLYSEAVEYIKTLLTATQFRRLWLYCVEELTEEEIAAREGVGRRRISTSITSAKKKVYKFFVIPPKTGAENATKFTLGEGTYFVPSLNLDK